MNQGILGHYVATASPATGVYETLNNFSAVPPDHPTVFEYLPKELKRPLSDAWVVAPSNGFNRPSMPRGTESNAPMALDTLLDYLLSREDRKVARLLAAQTDQSDVQQLPCQRLAKDFSLSCDEPGFMSRANDRHHLIDPINEEFAAAKFTRRGKTRGAIHFDVAAHSLALSG